MTISQSARRRSGTLSCTVFNTLARKYRVPHLVHIPAGTFSMSTYCLLDLAGESDAFFGDLSAAIFTGFALPEVWSIHRVNLNLGKQELSGLCFRVLSGKPLGLDVHPELCQ